MGTNYYLRAPEPETCPCCGHAPKQEEIHLGKASFGWSFIFRGNKGATGPAVETYAQWLENIYTHTRQGWLIWDEYRAVVTAPELEQLIERTRGGKNHIEYCREAYCYDTLLDDLWMDEQRHAFSGRDFS